MKHIITRIIPVLLLLCMVVSLLPGTAAAAGKITTTPTGYTSAEDVQYVKRGKYVLNWGARGEDCTFLTTYAEDFYTGSYTYDILSEEAGGSGTSNAYSSELYQALQSMMKAEHSHQTAYQETRYQYCYTDCLLSDKSHISSFYSGKELSGTWDGGATWNREHTWPNSKGLGGNDENDIMMLDFIKHTGKHYIVITSKADKIAKTKVSSCVADIAKILDVPEDLIFAYSSETKLNQEIIWEVIEESLYSIEAE